VVAGGVCGRTAVSGWYGKLYLDAERAGEYDPVVADMHTQPTDNAHDWARARRQRRRLSVRSCP
jgi:hypothetical protein